MKNKTQKYYEICHDNDFRRDNDVHKITGGDNTNYYDYYDKREKQKLAKAGDLKEN